MVACLLRCQLLTVFNSPRRRPPRGQSRQGVLKSIIANDTCHNLVDPFRWHGNLRPDFMHVAGWVVGLKVAPDFVR